MVLDYTKNACYTVNAKLKKSSTDNRGRLRSTEESPGFIGQDAG